MTRIDQYEYELPAELIAQAPLPNRTDSRMLVVSRVKGEIFHSHVRDLLNWLTPSDCLVMNNTRVLPAKLDGRRAATGGRWTGLYIRSDENGLWQVLSKTRGRLAPGDVITLLDRTGRTAFGLTMVAKLDDGSWIVTPDREGPAETLLEGVGRVPLPPYIRKGKMEESDFERYQTVYAERAGAVAAPTAGLHFNDTLLNKLKAGGVGVEQLTLHVGLGTFRPVSVEQLDDHDMHYESGEIDQSTVDRLNRLRRAGGRIIAVGTTSVRVLETAAHEGGRQEAETPTGESQEAGPSPLQPWHGETNLFIRPGFEFQATDGMLTNFHLPRSTLLVLVRTFGGDALMTRAYEEAIRERYRFYSYGDAMLIL